MGEFDYLYTPRPLPRLIKDPYERERENLSLAALARARDLGDLEFTQKKQGMADDEVIRKLWPDLVRGGFTDETIKNVLPAAGTAAPALMKLVGDQRKSMLESEKTKGEIKNKDTETKLKVMDAVGGVAEGELNRPGGPDHLSVQRMQNTLKQFGYDDPFEGDVNNPQDRYNYLYKTRNLAFSVKEQVTARLTEENNLRVDDRTRLRDDATRRNQEDQRRYNWATLEETKKQHGESNAIAREGAGGTVISDGFTPDGKPIFRRSKSDVQYTKEPGQPGGTPYSGPIVSGTDTSKMAQKRIESGNHLQRLQNLSELVDANPRAFNMASAVTASIPGVPVIAKNYLAEKQMSPEDRVVRAKVMRESAELINELYGAAQSAGEAKRAATFVINEEDDLATAKNKLKAAIAYASQIAGRGASIPGRIISRPKD